MKPEMLYFVCHITDAIIAWFYFESFLTKKHHILLRLLIFAAGNALLYCFIKQNCIIWNMTVFTVLYTSLVLLNYSADIKSAITHSVFLNFIRFAGELLVILILGAFGYSFTVCLTEQFFMIIMAAGSRFLYLIVTQAVILTKNRSHEKSGLIHLPIFFLSLPVSSALIGVMIVDFGFAYKLQEVSSALIAISLLGLLFINLISLMLYNQFRKKSLDARSLELMLQKEEADTTYYEALQKQFENQRLLVHDIKNHLNSISALAEDAHCLSIVSYIAELNAEYRVDEYARMCANPVLNAILIRFRESCSQDGINFHCDIRSHTVSFLDSASITALFGNLLSNAAEAAVGSKDHFIELTVQSRPAQKIIFISAINSCKNAPVMDKHGNFISSKKPIPFTVLV